MNEKTFEELVAKRAHDNVQSKIRVFENTLDKAFEALTGTRFFSERENEPDRSANKMILMKMVEVNSIHFGRGWPAYLWRTEEAKIRADVLSTMDVMQKMLIAPEPQDTDCLPAE